MTMCLEHTKAQSNVVVFSLQNMPICDKIYWSKVLTDQPGLCRCFRKYKKKKKKKKKKKTNKIKKSEKSDNKTDPSKLLIFISEKIIMYFFFVKKWKVPYQNTRLQFHSC